MNRDTLLAGSLLLGVAAVLGAGLWMWVQTLEPGSAQTDAPSAATSEDSRAHSNADKASATRKAGRPSKGTEPPARTVSVPDCPLALRLDASFRRADTDGQTAPDLRLASERRMVQVDVSCRHTRAEPFDRTQFLEDVYRGMKLKHKAAVRGRTSIRMQDGKVAGSSIQIREAGSDRLTYNNVLVRDRTIVMLNVGGPVGEVTRKFNEWLLDERLVWSR